MPHPNPVLSDLVTATANIRGAAQSAEAALNGIAAKIQAAVDAALENGATAEELAPVTDVVTALNDEAASLAAAVAANP